MTESAQWVIKNYPKCQYEHYGELYHAEKGVWVSDANGELILLSFDKGIYRYNVDADDWNKIMDYPDNNNYHMSRGVTQRINNKNKIIMLCECSFSTSNDFVHQLVEFDLDTKTFQCIVHSKGNEIDGSSIIQFCDILFDDNNIHYLTTKSIRRTDPQMHKSFDLNSKKIEIRNKNFNLPKTCKKPVYVKCRNSIITTRETDINWPHEVHIMEYNCQEKKWNMWDSIEGINYNSSIVTLDDENNRYLIFFGGQNIIINKKGRKDEFDFTILDLKKNKLNYSRLKFSHSCGRSDIVITRNKFRDNCLVFGYLRDWKSIDLKLILTKDLVNIIDSYVCFDTIHWIKQGALHAAVPADQLFLYAEV